eukprot:4589103-Alexandrium_andersonii.AAC.1
MPGTDTDPCSLAASAEPPSTLPSSSTVNWKGSMMAAVATGVSASEAGGSGGATRMDGSGLTTASKGTKEARGRLAPWKGPRE